LKNGTFARFIPANVYTYVVTVCEQGTTTAVVTPVSINKPDSGDTVDASITEVPTGWKTVRVFAYDSSKTLLAQGSSDVYVKLSDQGSSDVSVTLTSTSDPPTVSSTTPVNAATAVSINAKVTVLFSMTMLESSLTTDTFYITSSQGKVSGTVTTDGSTSIFAPSEALQPLTTYTAVVKSDVKSTAGLSMGSDYTWSFTTGEKPDTTPPAVKETSPSSGAASVDTGATISAVFTKNIDPETVNSTTFTVTAGKAGISGTISTLGNSVSFVPSTSLTAGTAYTAMLGGTIKDLAGNAMGNDYTWSFTTKQSGGGGGGGGGGSTPTIASIATPVMKANYMSITGTNFGATSGTVTIGGVAHAGALIAGWTDTLISVTVSTSVPTGAQSVTVTDAASRTSSAYSVTVLGWSYPSSSFMANSEFNGVHFVSSTEGWAVGKASSNSLVMKTTDGGLNWTQQIPAASDGVTLTGVYFIDINTGIAIGNSTSGSGYYRTTNGGTSWIWTSLAAGTGNKVNDITFDTSHTIGWITGVNSSGNGVFFRSTDDGATWALGGGIIPITATTIYGITTVPGTTDYRATGIYYASTPDNGMCLLNSSGGANAWAGSGTLDLNTYNTYDIGFYSSLSGIVVGDTGGTTPVLFDTSNGGNNWTAYDLTGLTGISLLKSADTPDATHRYAVGNSGTIIAYDNTTSKWYVQTAPRNGNLSKVFFYNSTTGWAVGVRDGTAEVYWTTTGGQ
jgi:photosystem II stability/assembly factor-like uncharacterized protein